MTPAQCRAARALIGWSQQQLAKEARIGVSTVADFELTRRDVSPIAVSKIRVALEKHIEFINGKRPGLRLK
jgi:transcriptional regulator with XRE-family HTH domain